MKREVEGSNGKFFGEFCHCKDGRVIYLAHKQMKHIYKIKNAWCFEITTLDRAKRLGVSAIGVMVKDKTHGKMIWATNFEDMYDIGSFVPDIKHSKTPQRGLPLAFFRVDPTAHSAYISKAVKIR